MNSNAIEKIAVSHLNLAITQCEFLRAEINENDKTPSFDGHIELYSKAGNKKSDLIGRCDIQVKGKTIKSKHFKATITYPVEVDDLQNFLNNGGAIYFVVGIKPDNGEYQIYYNALLPVDLQNIIHQIKNNKKIRQKTKNIELEQLPKNPKHIEKIFSNFLFHRKHQFSNPLIPNPKTINSTEEITYRFWIDSISDIYNKPTYVYQVLPNNIYIPIGKMIAKEIDIEDAPLDISIDGKTYFHNATISFTKGNRIHNIHINVGLSIKSDEKNLANVKITQKCTISQYIKNLEFILALIKGKTLKIGNLAIGNNPKFSHNVSDVENELDFYRKIEKLLKRLNIKKEIKVRELTDAMFPRLAFLHDAIIEKKTFKENDTASAITPVDIGAIKCFILRVKKNENEVEYINPFENYNLKFEIDMFNNETKLNDERFSASLFVTFNESDFLKYDNINYDTMFKDIISTEYSDSYGQAINYFILNLLCAYDKKKDEEMLDCAIKTASWLYEKDNTDVNFLNKMQALYRRQSLSEEEIEKILQIKEATNNNEIIIGCSILLGEKHTYNHYMKKLSQERKEEFLIYPISHLLNT